MKEVLITFDINEMKNEIQKWLFISKTQIVSY